MAAAGLSSVYICAHLLGFGADAQRAVKKEEKSDLPPALQKVENEATKEGAALSYADQHQRPASVANDGGRKRAGSPRT